MLWAKETQGGLYEAHEHGKAREWQGGTAGSADRRKEAERTREREVGWPGGTSEPSALLCECSFSRSQIRTEICEESRNSGETEAQKVSSHRR